MRRSEAFPSQYLGKDDVEQDIIAHIKDVNKKTVKGDSGDEEKTTMTFEERDIKPMILNNTNWMAIEDAYGEESDDWRGKPVEIYVDPTVMFGGKRVGGVRVRIPKPTNGSTSTAQTEKATTIVRSVVSQINEAKKQVWLVNTDAGEFGTVDPKVADQCYKFQTSGDTVCIAWAKTAKGGRLIKSIAAAPNGGIDLDDPPF